MSEKVADLMDKESKNENDNTPEDLSSHEGDSEDLAISGPAASQIVEVNTDAVTLDVNKGVGLLKPISIDSIPDSKTTDDINSSWKMVLHEESRQYYYWNTETGETSWEVPDAVTKATGMTGGDATLLAEGKDIAATVGSNPFDVSFGGSVECTNQGGPEVNQCAEIYSADGNKLVNGSVVVSGLDQDNFGIENYLYQTTLAGGGDPSTSASEQIHGKYMNQLDGLAVDLPSLLVRQSEHLLERLNSQMGFDNDFRKHDLGLKCILEIEIRLSDFKSLLSYGSSVYPFWVHSETQIRRLQHTVDSIFGMCAKSEEKESSTTNAQSFEGKDEVCEDRKRDPDVDVNRDNSIVCVENSLASLPEVDMSIVKNPSLCDISHDEAVNVELQPANEYPTCSGEYTKVESKETAFAEGHDKARCQLNEDVDMDVDMEVEDVEHTSSRNIETHDTSLEQFVQPSPSTANQSQAFGDEFVPPLPEEEWIPPPPPDDESIPPPPPDEPPLDDPCLPPAPCYPEPMHSFSYSGGYNLTYPDPNFTYYVGSISEAPVSSWYGHADGFTSSVSNPQIYYEAVPNTQPQEVAVMASPVESTLYSSLEDRVLPTVPTITAAESSSYHIASAPMGYEALSYMTTLKPASELTTYPRIEADESARGSITEAAPSLVQVPATAVSAPATIVMDENVSAASNNLGTSLALSVSSVVSRGSAGTAAKGQSKALRSKKRSVLVTSSLKSNKKVSSLVDKWKAAKEQFHDEDEEEPESALEILEKKRQREIEEWRSRQLASGEAEENANFQPLGDDWRERVKRRRAEKKASVETCPDDVSSESGRPALTDLSKDLPPGWQAYWDESSGQVYYGNAITSETTWSRPTS
ncbi:hypothetical protein Dimus_019256 [Dionaea muscipula]